MKVKLLRKIRKTKIESFIYGGSIMYRFTFEGSYKVSYKKDRIMEDFMEAVRNKYYPIVKGYKWSVNKIWWNP